MTKTAMRRPITPLVMVVLFLLTATVAGAAELVIIGNQDLPTPDLEAKGLQRIYMGKLTRWDNDEAIVPVMLKAGPVHNSFVETYLDRSVHRFVTYWRQMVFTGKGMPPRSFENEQDLIRFVATTPGAVGYASAGTDVGEVKILSVIKD